MECMICKNKMNHYFFKKLNFTNLNNVEYVKCVNCGFVISKTHYELSDEQWRTVNEEYHSSYQGTCCASDDPNWIERLHEQAEVIEDMAKLGLIPQNLPWVDFGCGDGKLSNLLKKQYDLNLGKFDRYKDDKEFLSDDDLKNNKFDFVVTTSVFEHILKREMLDEINSLVSDSGVMGLHTLVAEEIPDNPEWFYLLPVHCAFYTNKSMQILSDDWGYTCSIYHVDSQLWLFFKTDPDKVENIVKNANAKKDRKSFYYHFKRGFMDYWKLEKDDVIKRRE